jgi:hypothetical protein
MTGSISISCMSISISCISISSISYMSIQINIETYSYYTLFINQVPTGPDNLNHSYNQIKTIHKSGTYRPRHLIHQIETIHKSGTYGSWYAAPWRSTGGVCGTPPPRTSWGLRHRGSNPNIIILISNRRYNIAY